MQKIAKLMVLLGLGLGSVGVYAKTCTTGQTCGNSCISWSSTCHIGTTTSTTTTTPSTTTTTTSSSLFTQQQLDAAKQAGIDQCKANPTSCGITFTDTNGSTQTGIDQCKANPTSCGITFTDTNGSTQTGIDQCKANPTSCGITFTDTNGSTQTGIDQCKANPTSCGLLNQQQATSMKNAAVEQCKTNPTSCDITVSTNEVVYDSKKGEVYIPSLSDNNNGHYEVYLMQKPDSFTFELDFSRTKSK